MSNLTSNQQNRLANLINRLQVCEIEKKDNPPHVDLRGYILWSYCEIQTTLELFEEFGIELVLLDQARNWKARQNNEEVAA